MADFDPDAYLGTPQPAAGGSFNPDAFLKGSSAPPPAQNPLTSAWEAGAEGALSGASANWRDEIYGASRASGLPEIAGGFRAPIGAARLAYEHMTGQRGPATEEYERARDMMRERQAQLQKEHPYAYGAGEFGGAAATMLAGPAGAAETLGGRLAGAAVSGAGYGAAAGAGEGQGLEESLMGAGKGTLTGAGLGVAGAGALEALSPLGRQVGNVVRGIRDPDEEAARRVAAHMTSDFDRAGPSLTPEEIAAANAAGLPRALVDAGGESVRALARSAANTSPEARAALTEMSQARFEQQSPRIAGFIRDMTGGADATSDLERLQAAATRANRPAYRTAYEAGQDGIWNEELERLVSAPSVRKAMQNAVARGQDRAVVDGFGGFNPGVTFENGIMKFGQGKGVPPYPNMQFWDYTQRELRDMANAAKRSGANEEAGALTGLRRKLLSELDNEVPEFASARQGAAQFFGGENALEAGQNFVKSNANIGEARRALARMSPAERTLFARGYASNLADMIERAGNSRNVLNATFLNNSAAQQRTLMALGADRARQLEALLRAERVVDRARTGLGNSTTARQLAEMGLAGGATAGATGLLEQDFNPSHLLSAALMGGVLHRGAQVVDQRVARRVGEMLASSDPTVLARGVQAAARNPGIFNALRQATGAGARGGTELTQPAEKPSNGFKHGGSVDTPSEAKSQGAPPLITRKESHYSPTRGKPGHKCGVCVHYRKPNRCTEVGGVISPAGGCDWFEPTAQP
jgi:hypothetical protein